MLGPACGVPSRRRRRRMETYRRKEEGGVSEGWNAGKGMEEVKGSRKKIERRKEEGREM